MGARWWALSVGALGLALVAAGTAAVAQEVIDFRYDVRGRLVGASRSGVFANGVHSTYSYDKADNRLLVTVGAGSIPLSHRSGDFNGDGRDDILWRDASGLVTNWLMQADGKFFNNRVASGLLLPTDWTIVGIGDFNNDGRSDFLGRRDNGEVSNWLGQANGSFVSNGAVALASIPTDWKVSVVGDFNGDGYSDIMWRHNGGDVGDWLGRPGGSFVNNGGALSGYVPNSWKIVGVGDFNGDGRDDILWREDAGDLGLWLGKAEGGFINNGANGASVEPNWKIIGSGDFNGDGKADILWRHIGGFLTNWLGSATGAFNQNPSSTYDQSISWQIVATGDYNADGKSDITWRSNNGTFSNWLGGAGATFANNDVNALSEVSPSWQVQPR